MMERDELAARVLRSRYQNCNAALENIRALRAHKDQGQTVTSSYSQLNWRAELEYAKRHEIRVIAKDLKVELDA